MPGLQVLNRAGAWVDVSAPPSTFVCNIGDLMQHWTNDRWISTMHRVVNPPREAAAGNRRLSIPFFHQPNYDALIECLPHLLRPGQPGPLRGGHFRPAPAHQVPARRRRGRAGPARLTS